MRPLKLIVADRHAIVRRGLEQITAAIPAWQIAGEASSADELRGVLSGVDADVLVLDDSLAIGSVPELLAVVRETRPALPVLILSASSEEHYAVRAIRAGAAGFVQKDRPPEEIIDAIERVGAGRTYVSESVRDRLADTLPGGDPARPHEQLSTREFQVFRLIADGKSVTEIADALNVSVKTVSTYRTRALEKTGFRTNADIIAYAIRSGLL